MQNKSNKLTLSVDADIVARAKMFAEEKRTTLTALVQDYLGKLTNGTSSVVYTHLKGNLIEFDENTMPSDIRNSFLKRHFAYLDSGELILFDYLIYKEVSRIRDFILSSDKVIHFETMVSNEKLMDIYRTKVISKKINIEKMQEKLTDILLVAIKNKSTDVHISCESNGIQIRYRMDGCIFNIQDLAPEVDIKFEVTLDLIHYLSEIAGIDQDLFKKEHEYHGGRITSESLNFSQEVFENISSIRLHINPLPKGGRYAIMRIIYRSMSIEGGISRLKELGFNPKTRKDIKEMLKKPFGICCIGGSTGFGKTTTLAVLGQLEASKGNKSVISFEQPIEYTIKGAQQIPIIYSSEDKERSEKFKRAIMDSLRSDPQLVIISEIRDKDSCKLAFTAAMTGHQVWTSLLTNDSISIMDRLRDLDVPIYQLADPTLVAGLGSQRLIRVLCPHCKISHEKALEKKIVEQELIDTINKKLGTLKNIFFQNPEGCEKCSGIKSGYNGRTVISETIVPDIKFMQLYKIDIYHAFLHAQNELGFISMQDDAIYRMSLGLLDPIDVEDKTGDISYWDETRKDYIFRTLAETK